MRRLLPISGVLAATFLLAACGGSGSDEPPTTPPLLVNAGPDFTVNEMSNVALSGTASGESETLTFSWSIAPQLTITHEDTSVSNATLTSPETRETLNYDLTLTVTDDSGNRATDQVVMTVSPVNALPQAVISHNQIDSLPTRQYPAGYPVLLDGSDSFDPDAVDGEDEIAVWQWEQTAGQDVLAGVETNKALLPFNAPILSDSNTVTFALTVTDQEGGTDTTDITLDIISESASLPIISAGVAHEVFSGENVILNGTAESYAPNAQPLNYVWSTQSPLTPTIDNAGSLQTFAIAPAVTSTQVLVFDLAVTDQFGNVVEDNIEVTVKPLPRKLMNDTGILVNGDEAGNTTAYTPGYPGQDAQRGQDIAHERGFFEKAGRGESGFDFTRLNENGDEVDNVNLPWRCVRDNVSGLVWEVKVDGVGLFSSNNSYSWLFAENTGGFNGVADGGACTGSSCDTSSYINQVNAQGLCGFFDWRLPTHNELLSILHLGKSTPPLVDLDYFPNTATDISPPLWYWTRIPSIDGAGNEEAQNAWAIDFGTGTDNFLNKGTPARIRLVRAGR